MTKVEAPLAADQAPVPGALQVSDPGLINEGARNVPYFTPIQDPAAGTARDPQPDGTLFSPLKIRGLTLHNRIIVSPMCQYSADKEHMTAWHKTHLQSYAVRGAGLVLTEVQAVMPEGRISPEDLGIWDDSQLVAAKEVIYFVHSQGGHIGAQIGHAGRKASTVAPWIDRKAVAGEKGRGWPKDVYGPSAVAYSDDTYVPKEMTLEDIETVKAKWVDAVKRAVKVGYDDYPVLVRLAGTDYLEFDPSIPQWDILQAQKLSKILADKGADFLDISAGGQDARMKVVPGPKYQAYIAEAIRKAVEGTDTLVGSVGGIATGKDTTEVLADGQADAILVGRAFLKEPNLVCTWADELDIDVHAPSQCELKILSIFSNPKERYFLHKLDFG
ncbi:NADH:flavin oxidoreductase/NADH oxidase [Colletotrichum salicis]|uniref:NADH:flavin oxidoreductase/NADH oxidase n=1 Tax=Colletotrichum salicis TaxID=1209931 RepID=A0A135UFW6_9PEZI|nr:NADH:flavin oxidoreductase/NADH oxidase [Colletotrichum salicis]